MATRVSLSMASFTSAARAIVLALVVGTSLAPFRLARAQEAPAETVPGNRLKDQTSPYLLMHAHNPVHWHPWGEEALEEARQSGKPIFLSIGYSSCYWCHVMERESFMDKEVADYLNAHFVCIKVDREERPDIDQLYMTSLQVYSQLAGSAQAGGWPLSMFLTPEGEPFFGGTYFPPRGKLGPTGFMDVLVFIHKTWKEQPEKVRRDAQLVVRAVRSLSEAGSEDLAVIEADVTRDTFAELASQYDPEHGGFGFSASNPRQPKFPEPANLRFLAAMAEQEGAHAEEARQMLRTTLERMALGGIRDHVGGGFHRYSTDRYWAVPHFEKMLYDNAQLASVYSHASVQLGREDFAELARETLDFVLRELTAAEGGFYSAVDAETNAQEGQFYVWRDEELDSTLEAAERTLLDQTYGTAAGKAVFEGGHVLLLQRPLSEIAAQRGTSERELRAELGKMREKLLAARNERERPLTDTKILTAWNGLMIRGFADTGRLLNQPTYTQAAARAAEFILSKLRTDDGRLMRSYAAGVAQLNGYLDDYAFLVDGLLALWEATGDRRWLDEAEAITKTQCELFWDAGQGGFFFTSHDHEELFVRSKTLADGALPAGNSVAALNLLILAEAREQPLYRERAQKTIEAALPLMRRVPAAAPLMGVAVLRYLDTHEAPAPRR